MQARKRSPGAGYCGGNQRALEFDSVGSIDDESPLEGEALREALLREYLGREAGAPLPGAAATPPEEELLRAMAAESMEELDLTSVRRVLDAFLGISGMSMALVAASGRLLVASNWRPICSEFHRVHPRTRAACEETDRMAGRAIAEAAARGASSPPAPHHYRCANGLREIAQPLFIEGAHWATIYLGQFLYDDDALDEEEFARRARSLGWDEAAYLEALRDVPRYSAAHVEQALAFCVSFGDLVSRLNYSSYRQGLLARHFLRIDGELRAALEQKDFLFAELQHRVKNSLTLIASLLSLESASFSDGRLKRAFEDAQGRLRSVALLYERLYATRSVSSIDLGAYVVDAAKAAFEGLSSFEGNVELETDCASVRIDTRRAVYVGLVVHELAVNALKHAFPEGGRGRLLVSLAERGGEVELAAADDGVGLPPGFSLEGGSSLGMLVVRTLAKQLDGEASAGPGLGGALGTGARFSVRFPAL